MVGIKRWFASATADNLVRIIAIISLFLSILVSYRAYTTAQCLTDYIKLNAEVSKATRSIAADDRKVIDDAFKSFIVSKDNDDVKKAFDNYFAARTRNEELRKQTPPPDAPSGLC